MMAEGYHWMLDEPLATYMILSAVGDVRDIALLNSHLWCMTSTYIKVFNINDLENEVHIVNDTSLIGCNGLVATKDGNVIVATAYGLQQFGADTKHLVTIDTGNFIDVTTGNGKIHALMCDEVNRIWIKTYTRTPEGQEGIYSILTELRSDEQLFRCVALPDILLVSDPNKKIYQISPIDGKKVRRFGKRRLSLRKQNDIPSSPYVCDSDGRNLVLVADKISNELKVLRPDSKDYFTINLHEGSVSKPIQAVVDANNRRLFVLQEDTSLLGFCVEADVENAKAGKWRVKAAGEDGDELGVLDEGQDKLSSTEKEAVLMTEAGQEEEDEEAVFDPEESDKAGVRVTDRPMAQMREVAGDPSQDSKKRASGGGGVDKEEMKSGYKEDDNLHGLSPAKKSRPGSDISTDTEASSSNVSYVEKTTYTFVVQPEEDELFKFERTPEKLRKGKVPSTEAGSATTHAGRVEALSGETGATGGATLGQGITRDKERGTSTDGETELIDVTDPGKSGYKLSKTGAILTKQAPGGMTVMREEPDGKPGIATSEQPRSSEADSKPGGIQYLTTQGYATGRPSSYASSQGNSLDSYRTASERLKSGEEDTGSEVYLSPADTNSEVYQTPDEGDVEDQVVAASLANQVFAQQPGRQPQATGSLPTNTMGANEQRPDTANLGTAGSSEKAESFTDSTRSTQSDGNTAAPSTSTASGTDTTRKDFLGKQLPSYGQKTDRSATTTTVVSQRATQYVSQTTTSFQSEKSQDKLLSAPGQGSSGFDDTRLVGAVSSDFEDLTWETDKEASSGTTKDGQLVGVNFGNADKFPGANEKNTFNLSREVKTSWDTNKPAVWKPGEYTKQEIGKDFDEKMNHVAGKTKGASVLTVQISQEKMAKSGAQTEITVLSQNELRKRKVNAKDENINLDFDDKGFDADDRENAADADELDKKRTSVDGADLKLNSDAEPLIGKADEKEKCGEALTNLPYNKAYKQTEEKARWSALLCGGAGCCNIL